uniref:Chlorophyllase-1, chloroplastic n=1 Tax=Anthurium amnicola TaxID=1678845 RepID=A0A1D1Y532_9ARAE
MGNLSFGLAFLFLPFLLGVPAVIPDPLGLPQAEELIRELSLVRDGEERAVARRFGRMAAVVDASSVEALFFPGNLSVLIHHKGTQDLHDSLPESVQNLLIVTPTQDGLYPVMLFFHGSTLKNHQYRQLFEHIASHGYIVVAPQVCE